MKGTQCCDVITAPKRLTHPIVGQSIDQSEASILTRGRHTGSISGSDDITTLYAFHVMKSLHATAFSMYFLIHIAIDNLKDNT